MQAIDCFLFSSFSINSNSFLELMKSSCIKFLPERSKASLEGNTNPVEHKKRGLFPMKIFKGTSVIFS